MGFNDEEVPVEADPMDSLDEASRDLVDKLKQAIEAESRTPLFTCGGSIPIIAKADQQPSLAAAEPSPQEGEKAAAAAATVASTPPVAIRWGSPGVLSDNTKLFFPVEDAMKPNLAQLVRTTEPAGFGRGEQLVFDETYRKAAKMDPDSFSTSFNPYELGIVDAIAQALLPSVKAPDQCRSVRAELYKLNIYSGPSGRFKAHVDTPRSISQFGSLVVCLPVEHEGGQLQVRHNGKEMTFDWGTKTSDPDHAAARWAAFYSDCEHEVLEVKSGHRITLTYNLYAARGNPFLAGTCPTLDPSRFPVHQIIGSMLQESDFLKDGGVLGFFCSHAYPHTSSDSGLPDTLKGLDMVLWQSLRALGLSPQLRPVLANSDSIIEACDWKYANGKPKKGLPSSACPRGWVARGLGGPFVRPWQIDTYPGILDLVKDWAETPHGKQKKHERMRYAEVLWLTKPKHKNVAVQYIAYGNEPGIETWYTQCAITVRIGKPGSRHVVAETSPPAKTK